MKGNQKWWLLSTIIWMLVIFLVTQLPYFTGDHTAKALNKVVIKEHTMADVGRGFIDELNFLIRKASHLSAFGILAFLLYKVMGSYRFAWLVAFLYAMTDEWHQSFMPGRMASVKDVLIDGSGALIFLFLTYLVRRKRKKAA
ncbi:VanZ family protein [Bacillus xiapuensis]|uniref:VanZ family protein n=1 Tax=Bacillus xiapuensis TaxID=2014075 RepID=A0ABU6NC28_9BACI|nr:VanZ family protein [Bacillus xiapuensis]